MTRSDSPVLLSTILLMVVGFWLTMTRIDGLEREKAELALQLEQANQRVEVMGAGRASTVHAMQIFREVALEAMSELQACQEAAERRIVWRRFPHTTY